MGSVCGSACGSGETRGAEEVTDDLEPLPKDRECDDGLVDSDPEDDAAAPVDVESSAGGSFSRRALTPAGEHMKWPGNMVVIRCVSSPFEPGFSPADSVASRELEDLLVEAGEGVCWCSEVTFPRLVDDEEKRSGKSSISLRSLAPALG